MLLMRVVRLKPLQNTETKLSFTMPNGSNSNILQASVMVLKFYIVSRPVVTKLNFKISVLVDCMKFLEEKRASCYFNLSLSVRHCIRSSRGMFFAFLRSQYPIKLK